MPTLSSAGGRTFLTYYESRGILTGGDDEELCGCRRLGTPENGCGHEHVTAFRVFLSKPVRKRNADRTCRNMNRTASKRARDAAVVESDRLKRRVVR